MAHALFSLWLCITTAVFCGHATLVLSSTINAGQRKDVIGQYRLSNEEQCRRLCWYRPLCWSYSYHADASISAVSCVLHTKAVNTSDENTAKNSPGWTETEASSANINNGCKLRTCNHTEVCVPTSPFLVTTSSESVSHVCLPLPSKCGEPAAVLNGDVLVSGYNQDDVAHVTCDVGYVALPMSVSMELSCLVTSEWTSFDGKCSKYEFNIADPHFYPNLLWELREDSTLCATGVFLEAGRMFFRLRVPSELQDGDVHILFRYYQGDRNNTDVVWYITVNARMKLMGRLGDMPLLPGDSFNLTLHVHSDRLQYTLNEAHVYSIPLDSVQNYAYSIDISKMKSIGIGGEIQVTYINLMSGC